MPKTKKSKDDIRTALRVLLRGYMRFAGTDRKSAICDLLTELMHLCNSYHLDFHGIEAEVMHVLYAVLESPSFT